MMNLAHDFDLRINIFGSILQKLFLVKLLGSEWNPSSFISHPVNNSKSAFANHVELVVL